MSSRIAFGGFLHETNTFAPSKAGMAAFEQGGGWPPLARGEAISAAVTNVNVGAAGFLDVAREKGWEAVPTLWCAASPSAHVTAEAFEAIAGELVERIRATLPVDGVYLDLHGAMVSENFDDGEGEILRRVRAVIGPDVPLVASLDLHGNVTPLMVEELIKGISTCLPPMFSAVRLEVFLKRSWKVMSSLPSPLLSIWISYRPFSSNW